MYLLEDRFLLKKNLLTNLVILRHILCLISRSQIFSEPFCHTKAPSGQAWSLIPKLNFLQRSGIQHRSPWAIILGARPGSSGQGKNSQSPSLSAFSVYTFSALFYSHYGVPVCVSYWKPVGKVCGLSFSFSISFSWSPWPFCQRQGLLLSLNW